RVAVARRGVLVVVAALRHALGEEHGVRQAVGDLAEVVVLVDGVVVGQVADGRLDFLRGHVERTDVGLDLALGARGLIDAVGIGVGVVVVLRHAVVDVAVLVGVGERPVGALEGVVLFDERQQDEGPAATDAAGAAGVDAVVVGQFLVLVVVAVGG